MFGVVTTYEEWRFYWFSDSNIMATSNVEPGQAVVRNYGVSDSGTEDELLDEPENKVEIKDEPFVARYESYLFR